MLEFAGFSFAVGRFIGNTVLCASDDNSTRLSANIVLLGVVDELMTHFDWLISVMHHRQQYNVMCSQTT